LRQSCWNESDYSFIFSWSKERYWIDINVWNVRW
jgi:hypothetical protein